MLTSLLTQHKNAGYRFPLLIEGEENAVYPCLLSYLDTIKAGENQVLRVGNKINGINSTEYKHYLGHEFDVVIINGFDGFHVEAIAALSGTVVAGGLFILLMPALKPPQNWSAFLDPDFERFVQWGHDTKQITSYFLQRAETLMESSFYRCLGSDLTSTESTLIQQPISLANLDQRVATPFTLPTSLTLEQLKIKKDIISSVESRCCAASVITANRGRGKSALLGALAAELANLNKTVYVMAPRPDCIKQVQYWNNKLGGKLLEFIPVDQMNGEWHRTSILLIDEAAAIPISILTEATQHFKHVVYASTEHGYEGSGRGFTVRFLKWLEDNYSNKHYQLSAPIRWREGDPLEVAINKIMLLDAEPSIIQPEELHDWRLDDCECRWINSKELIESPALLQQVFGLLVQAHYRTTPADLRYMLDSPTFRVCILFSRKMPNIVQAVTLISIEGQLPTELSVDISRGLRRPKGHLIPQVIGAQMIIDEFASLQGWRVVRIATHSQLQGRGCGSQLLCHLYQCAEVQKLDYISTSFGMTIALLNFWQGNKYTLCRVGHKPDAATGEVSAVMLRALSKSACELLNEIAGLGQADFELQTGTHKNSKTVQMAKSLFLSGEFGLILPPDRVKKQLSAFAYYSANFSACRVALITYLSFLNEEEQDNKSVKLIKEALKPNIDTNALILLAKELKLGDITGKKQMTKLLREQVKSLLALDLIK